MSNVFITFDELKEIVEILKNVRYLIIPIKKEEIMMKSQEIATFINDRVGKINFSLDILEKLPPKMLIYNWSAYRM